MVIRANDYVPVTALWIPIGNVQVLRNAKRGILLRPYKKHNFSQLKALQRGVLNLSKGALHNT